MNNKPTLAAAGASNSPEEAALLAAFRSMSEGYRSNAIVVMQALARSFPRQRPTQTMVRASGGMGRKGVSS